MIFFKKYRKLLEFKNKELISFKIELGKINDVLFETNKTINDLNILIKERDILLEKKNIEIQDLKNKLDNFHQQNNLQKTECKNIITTGESEYYKGRLKDEKWREKSEYIKEFYSNKCYNCNCIKVDDIRDLYGDYIGNWDLILALEEIFSKKNILISKLSESEYFLNKITQSWYNKKLEIFSYVLEANDVDPFERSPRINSQIFSNEKIIASREIKAYNQKDFCTQNYFYEVKKGNIQDRINRLKYSYFDGIKTEGNIYVHFKKHYSSSYSEAQGIIFVDGFQIIFPLNYEKDYLTKVPDAKDVHHIVYPLSRIPWDSKNEDMVALCHECHKNEHINSVTQLPNDSSRVVE